MNFLRRLISIFLWAGSSILLISILGLIGDKQYTAMIILLVLTCLVMLVAHKTCPQDTAGKAPPSKPENTSQQQTRGVRMKPSSPQSNLPESESDDLVSFVISEDNKAPQTSQQHNFTGLSVSISATNDLYDFELKDTEQVISENETPGSWILPDEQVNIDGHKIKGMFYFGGRMRALDGRGREASLVDDSLPRVDTSHHYQDETLGYWPSYSSISEQCRGAYISWLSGPRDDPATPLGYVFIYFYGIERRLLVDLPNNEVSDDERDHLINEVGRLVSIFGNSRSFAGYANRLLDYLRITSPCKALENGNASGDKNHHSQYFKFKLSTAVHENRPIPADLALDWVLGLPEYQQKTAAKRCPEEFRHLFSIRYNEQYDNGLVIKPNKTKLRLNHYPASESLRSFSPAELDLPDPTALKAPVKKLVELADKCNSELDPYSRYVGQQKNSPTDIEAHLLLPEQLLGSKKSPLLGDLKDWMSQAVNQNSGIIAVSELWEKLDKTPPSKINKKEVELIEQITHQTGFSFAPDFRYHRIKPTPDGIIVLSNELHGQYFEPSTLFHKLATILRLGSTVACIDNQVKLGEIEFLTQLIDNDNHISPTEKSSLHTYLTWLLNSPIRMLGIKGALNKLSAGHKNIVGDILVEVAMSDGSVSPEEVKQLEKLYSALGLDKSKVTTDIHRLSSHMPTPRQKAADTAVPQPSDSGGFALDEERLKLLGRETAEVSAFIGDIFADTGEGDDIEKPPHTEEAAPEFKHEETDIDESTLDLIYQPVYEQLIAKDEWSREELATLCQQHKLMLDGTIEAINDWSFNMVDAALLEDEGDLIVIDLEIKQELQEMEQLA